MPQIKKDSTDEDLAYKYLMSYIAYNYPGYVIGDHNAVIADHLEAVERGELKRLMVFTPPRHGKTMMISEFFPPWYMGRNPDHFIIYSTYSFDRANDVGRKVRNQMTSEYHPIIFDECKISTDSKGANKFTTIQHGEYFSVGVGGGTTGRGANVFIIDDPIKSREEAESEIAQRKLRDWFTAVAYTRLMPNSAIILVMTRWHYYDLAGWLLKEKAHENWTVLSLPAIAIEEDDPIGRKPGAALWPDFYDEKALEKIKKTIGTRDWNSMYQQQPIPEEGGMIKLEWFKRYRGRDLNKTIQLLQIGVKPGSENLPLNFEKIVFSWDTAFKVSELNDPSACTIWGLSGVDSYLLGVFNKRVEFPDLKKTAVDLHEKYRKRFMMNVSQMPVLIEDKASGQSLIQELKRNSTLPIIGITPEASKPIRMSEVTALIEAGRVYLPEDASWLVDFETQICQFPLSKHDDMADSMSQYLRWSGKPMYRKRKGNELFWK